MTGPNILELLQQQNEWNIFINKTSPGIKTWSLLNRCDTLENLLSGRFNFDQEWEFYDILKTSNWPGSSINKTFSTQFYFQFKQFSANINSMLIRMIRTSSSHLHFLFSHLTGIINHSLTKSINKQTHVKGSALSLSLDLK